MRSSMRRIAHALATPEGFTGCGNEGWHPVSGAKEDVRLTSSAVESKAIRQTPKVRPDYFVSEGFLPFHGRQKPATPAVETSTASMVQPPPPYHSETWFVSKPGAVVEKKPLPRVKAEVYDAVQGGLHGVLQATTLTLLTPIDQMHAKVSVGMDAWKFSGSAYAKFIPSEPFKNAGNNFRTNVGRYPLVYTTLPIARDELQQAGCSETVSKGIAGGVAGTAEALITAPNTVQKIRAWTSNVKADDILVQMSRAEKRAAYRAAVSWGAARNAGYFIPLTIIADQLEKVSGNNSAHPSYLRAGMSGAAAGALATLVSYPFDVLQKRAVKNPDISMINQFRDCVRTEGLGSAVKGSYRGVSIALPRMVAASGLFQITKHLAEKGCESVMQKEMEQQPKKPKPSA